MSATERQNRAKRKRLKILLIKMDVSQSDIARACGISRQSAGLILSGYRSSKRVISYVASLVGSTPEDFYKLYVPRRKAA